MENRKISCPSRELNKFFIPSTCSLVIIPSEQSGPRLIFFMSYYPCKWSKSHTGWIIIGRNGCLSITVYDLHRHIILHFNRIVSVVIDQCLVLSIVIQWYRWLQCF